MPAVGGWLWGGRVTHVPAVPPHRVPCVTPGLRAHCHPRGTVGDTPATCPLVLVGTQQPPRCPQDTPACSPVSPNCVTFRGPPLPVCSFLCHPTTSRRHRSSAGCHRGPSGCHRGSGFLALPRSAPRYQGVSPGPEPSHRLLRHVPLATPHRGFSASSRLPGRRFGEVLWGGWGTNPLAAPRTAPAASPRPRYPL